MIVDLRTAQAMLLQAAAVMPKEYIPLEQCRQRVLAEPAVALADFPPFDRSPLDGYAVIAAEVRAATCEQPVLLRVVDNIPAGSMPQEHVIPGTAARIMTGAPVPAGSTGVVRLEDTRVIGQEVAILAGAGVDKNICRRGEEIVAGEELIPAGTKLNAGALGMLALLGIARPAVFTMPQVAILATGSEVAPVDAALAPGAIRNSNSYMIAAQVEEAGAKPRLLGIARDDVAEICACLAQADDCQVVISTGGVSAGDYDLMADVYKTLGISILFERVAIKPGMPVLAGMKDGRLYIGLSGNPAAAAVAFDQLVRPVLLKMAGRNDVWRSRVRATLAAPFMKSGEFTRFVWGRCWQQGAGLVAEPLSLQGNGMLKSAIIANAFIVIPEDCPSLVAGSEIDIILLEPL